MPLLLSRVLLVCALAVCAGSTAHTLTGPVPAHATSLVPFWVFCAYALIRGRRLLPEQVLIIMGAGLWVACAGSAGGPLQTVDVLNRITHAAVCGLVASVLLCEIHARLSAHGLTSRDIALTAAGLAVGVGVGMEVLELAVSLHIGEVIGHHRIVDTALDLVADSVGAVIGARLTVRARPGADPQHLTRP